VYPQRDCKYPKNEYSDSDGDEVYHIGELCYAYKQQKKGELPHPARADALAEGGASCFHDALCRYKCIHRERSLHRRAFGVSHS